MAKTIQDYKRIFAAVYSEMIADMGVESASVSVSWESKKVTNGWTKVPRVLITF